MIQIQSDSVEVDGRTFELKVFYDESTDTVRHEYHENGVERYYNEYPNEWPEPDKDFSMEALKDGFMIWYDLVAKDENV